jgi:two-component system OmpR family sensor kinase
MRTIRRQLVLGMLGATLACTIGASTLLYYALRRETNELADLQLRQLTAALPEAFPAEIGLPGAEDPEEDYVLQAWDQHGALLRVTGGQVALPRYDLRGFNVVTVRGERWRIYGETQLGRYVQAAQPVAVRERMAVQLTLRASLPLLAFVLVLTALILLVVKRALQPLDRLARAVAGRSPSALAPLASADMPPELQPVVQALNTLLGKFDDALTMQRTFVADAAHELRSPLTALKLQLQLAERANSDAARSAALAKLHERLDRGTHLVQQLLSLARHEGGHAAAQLQQVDLGQLLETAVIDHSVLADSRAIDLAGEVRGSVLARADRDGLRVLLNNLIDNALRYTQQGGQVDVSAGVERRRPYLRVADNGPGVPPQERGRLFDRFYRPDGNTARGCGLGLSIVKSVADLHGAEVELDSNSGGIGLVVTVRLPEQAAVATA